MRSPSPQSMATYRLGAVIRNRRTLLSLSQEELAHRSRLHRSYITDIERGARNPSLSTLTRLAEALRVSMADLFIATQDSVKSPARTHAKTRQNPGSGIAELLLVEDDRDEADLAFRALSKCNVVNRIHLVRDGVEALDFIFCRNKYSSRSSEQGPHAVLLDLGLPKLDGIEVLRSIRHNPATNNMPVVVLTSSTNPVNKAECQKLGVRAYIEKPLDFEKFSLAMPRMGLQWLLLNPL